MSRRDNGAREGRRLRWGREKRQPVVVASERLSRPLVCFRPSAPRRRTLSGAAESRSRSGSWTASRQGENDL